MPGSPMKMVPVAKIPKSSANTSCAPRTGKARAFGNGPATSSRKLIFVSPVLVSSRIFAGVAKRLRVSAIEFSPTDEVALRTAQPAGTLVSSFGSVDDAISEPSSKPSLSVSARLGFVPGSSASTKMPVLVSTRSSRPSESVSSLRGLVPVSVALT